MQSYNTLSYDRSLGMATVEIAYLGDMLRSPAELSMFMPREEVMQHLEVNGERRCDELEILMAVARPAAPAHAAVRMGLNVALFSPETNYEVAAAEMVDRLNVEEDRDARQRRRQQPQVVAAEPRGWTPEELAAAAAAVEALRRREAASAEAAGGAPRRRDGASAVAAAGAPPGTVGIHRSPAVRTDDRAAVEELRRREAAADVVTPRGLAPRRVDRSDEGDDVNRDHEGSAHRKRSHSGTTESARKRLAFA